MSLFQITATLYVTDGARNAAKKMFRLEFGRRSNASVENAILAAEN
jgi:hypothetical protein